MHCARAHLIVQIDVSAGSKTYAQYDEHTISNVLKYELDTQNMPRAYTVTPYKVKTYCKFNVDINTYICAIRPLLDDGEGTLKSLSGKFHKYTFHLVEWPVHTCSAMRNTIIANVNNVSQHNTHTGSKARPSPARQS